MEKLTQHLYGAGRSAIHQNDHAITFGASHPWTNLQLPSNLIDNFLTGDDKFTLRPSH
jgi:hypothetical protein